MFLICRVWLIPVLHGCQNKTKNVDNPKLQNKNVWHGACKQYSSTQLEQDLDISLSSIFLKKTNMHIFQRLNGSSIPLSRTQGNSIPIKNIQNEIRRFWVVQNFPMPPGRTLENASMMLSSTCMERSQSLRQEFTPPRLTWMAQWLMPLRMETPVKVGSMYEQLHFDLWCSKGL